MPAERFSASEAARERVCCENAMPVERFSCSEAARKHPCGGNAMPAKRFGASETKRFHLRFQGNTIRHRRVLSLFQLGTLILRASDPPKISRLDLNDALESLKHHVIIQ